MNTTEKADSAVRMLLDGFNCAQSVLVCCSEDRGLPREFALRVAQAFGGGIGRTGNLCGALTGALMTVGMRCAALEASDSPSKNRAHELARQVLSEFAARNKSLLCRDLTGCDLTTEEGHRRFKDEEIAQRVCAQLVRSAVEITEKVLS